MDLRSGSDSEIICTAQLLANQNPMPSQTTLYGRSPRTLFRAASFLILLILQQFSAPSVAAARPPADEESLSLLNPLISRWEYGTDQTLNLTPAVTDRGIYLPLAAGNLIALRLSDGKLDWRAEMGGDITASPASDERAVYAASQVITPLESAARTEGTLRALSKSSGVTLWARSLPSPLKGRIVADDSNIYGCGADGRLYAFEKETGKIRWVLGHNSPLTTPPTDGGRRLYVGARDGSLLSVEKQNGTKTWRYQTPGPALTSIAVGDRRVFLGTAEGLIVALEEGAGGLLWRVRNGSGIQSLAVTPHGLAATSSDNFVYLLSLKRGRRVWKRQMSGRVTAPPAVLSQQAFFCPLAGEECVVLDLKTGRKVNRLVVGEDNNTSAAPQLVGGLLLVTTRRGLLAFSNPEGR